MLTISNEVAIFHSRVSVRSLFTVFYFVQNKANYAEARVKQSVLKKGKSKKRKGFKDVQKQKERAALRENEM